MLVRSRGVGERAVEVGVCGWGGGVEGMEWCCGCTLEKFIRCAVENDRKHDDLCVGSTGIRPMDQQRTS